MNQIQINPKINSMKKILTLALVLGLTTACNGQWGKRIKGNGQVITQERSVGEYSGVSLSGWFDVELVSGREGEITLRGESNLLEHIVTEVENGNLVIKNEKGYNLSSSPRTGVQITVPVESISQVNLSGSGDINSRISLSSDDFDIRVSGSGDVQLPLEAERVSVALSGSGDIGLSGTSRELKVSVSGSGDVKAFGLTAETVKVNVAGSADVEVTATGLLEARVSGSGDVEYRGNPKKVDAKSVGSGDISKG